MRTIMKALTLLNPISGQQQRQVLARRMLLLSILAGCITIAPSGFADSTSSMALKSPSDFADISDARQKGEEMFRELGKVLQHPRCVNCHPKGERPLQGEQMLPHEPLVVRGDGGLGVAGMRCLTCHGRENYDAKGVPGHPAWHLAPASMAWEGKTLGEICEQIKDKKRNGGKDMEALIHHMAEDSLVGWGWHPGKGREPVPGTQQQFGDLFKAWAEAGAICPAS